MADEDDEKNTENASASPVPQSYHLIPPSDEVGHVVYATPSTTLHGDRFEARFGPEFAMVNKVLDARWNEISSPNETMVAELKALANPSDSPITVAKDVEQEGFSMPFFDSLRDELSNIEESVVAFLNSDESTQNAPVLAADSSSRITTPESEARPNREEGGQDFVSSDTILSRVTSGWSQVAELRSIPKNEYLSAEIMRNTLAGTPIPTAKPPMAPSQETVIAKGPIQNEEPRRVKTEKIIDDPASNLDFTLAGAATPEEDEPAYTLTITDVSIKAEETASVPIQVASVHTTAPILSDASEITLGYMTRSPREELTVKVESLLDKYRTTADDNSAIITATNTPVKADTPIPVHPSATGGPWFASSEPRQTEEAEVALSFNTKAQPADHGSVPPVDLTHYTVLDAIKAEGGRGSIFEDSGARAEAVASQAALEAATAPIKPNPVIPVEKVPLPDLKSEAVAVEEKASSLPFPPLPPSRPDAPAEAKVAMPRARPPTPVADPSVDRQHHVKSGDSIENIAQHYLKIQHNINNPERDLLNNAISHIASANGFNEATVHILNPERTPPLSIPKDLVSEAPNPLDFVLVNRNAGKLLRNMQTSSDLAPAALDKEGPSLQEIFGPKAAGERIDITYIAKSGDSLGKIAKKFYGHFNAHKEIAEYNGIKDADDLDIGQEIQLPPELADHIRKTALDEQYGGVQAQAVSLNSKLELATPDIAS